MPRVTEKTYVNAILKVLDIQKELDNLNNSTNEEDIKRRNELLEEIDKLSPTLIHMLKISKLEI